MFKQIKLSGNVKFWSLVVLFACMTVGVWLETIPLGRWLILISVLIALAIPVYVFVKGQGSWMQTSPKIRVTWNLFIFLWAVYLLLALIQSIMGGSVVTAFFIAPIFGFFKGICFWVAVTVTAWGFWTTIGDPLLYTFLTYIGLGVLYTLDYGGIVMLVVRYALSLTFGFSVLGAACIVIIIMMILFGLPTQVKSTTTPS